MSNARLFRITVRGPKHFRHEALVNGAPSGRAYYGPRFGQSPNGKDVETVKTVMVVYGAAPGLKNEILLTEDESKKLKHMGLVPVLGNLIEKTSETTAKIKSITTIDVPDDWVDLPDEQKILLASQIANKTVNSKSVAERIISSFVAKMEKAKDKS